MPVKTGTPSAAATSGAAGATGTTGTTGASGALGGEAAGSVEVPPQAVGASDAAESKVPAPIRPTAEDTPDPTRPPPLHVEYVQYGVALAVEMNVSTGATCPDPDVIDPETGEKPKPCILGSGGGLGIRLGYRAPGPWYIGGAYEFIKMDSGNLYRLGIFQQLRAEFRYLPDIGYRAAPYISFGLGGMVYGNEWGVETGGGLIFGGAGVEIEVSRLALLGASFVYRPVLIAGWNDTAGQARPLGVAQFLGIDLILEVRTETGRR